MTNQQIADTLLSQWQLQRAAGVPANDRVFTIAPPYQRWRYPPGCPDADWCSGNSTCHWDCQGDPDAGIDAAFERDLSVIRACMERDR